MPVAIPQEATGLRLCKMRGEELVLCETLIFAAGNKAVETVLRRASLSGSIGPVGETGNYWADLMRDRDTWIETIALDRGSWNALKNHWARCKLLAPDPHPMRSA